MFPCGDFWGTLAHLLATSTILHRKSQVLWSTWNSSGPCLHGLMSKAWDTHFKKHPVHAASALPLPRSQKFKRIGHHHSSQNLGIEPIQPQRNEMNSLMSIGGNLILVAWSDISYHKHYKQTTIHRMDVPVLDSAPKIHRILHQPPVLYPSDRNLIQAGSWK